MVSRRKNTRMNPLAKRFLLALEEGLPRGGFQLEPGDRPIIRIPARNPEVGGITVWIDADEVTVETGQLHHCHFEAHSRPEEAVEDREQAAAESAAAFIQDILEERVHFLTYFEGERCRGACSWYPDAGEAPSPMEGVTEIREYVWFGRIS